MVTMVMMEMKVVVVMLMMIFKDTHIFSSIRPLPPWAYLCCPHRICLPCTHGNHTALSWTVGIQVGLMIEEYSSNIYNSKINCFSIGIAGRSMRRM